MSNMFTIRTACYSLNCTHLPYSHEYSQILLPHFLKFSNQMPPPQRSLLGPHYLQQPAHTHHVLLLIPLPQPIYLPGYYQYLVLYKIAYFFIAHFPHQNVTATAMENLLFCSVLQLYHLQQCLTYSASNKNTDAMKQSMVNPSLLHWNSLRPFFKIFPSFFFFILMIRCSGVCTRTRVLKKLQILLPTSLSPECKGSC